MKRNLLLIITFVLLFTLPDWGSHIKWHGSPPGFGEFPAQKVADPPGFNLTYFIIAATVSFVILMFLLFPKLFGFKKTDLSVYKPQTVSFPPWFWPGVWLTLVSWFFMWGRFELVQPIDHYTFVPLWWGFILVLDGLVYKRNSGVSLISSKANTMKLLGTVSCISWFVFEFLNFFVLENWYYPNNKIFTNFGNISWQLLSYTTVLPAIFEWYSLLRTFPTMRKKYAFGPKVQFPKSVQIVFLLIGVGLSFFMGLYPYILFWMLWVGLIPALGPAMSLSGRWTPFSPIGQDGNYSQVVLVAISTFLNGLFWEFWNFGSEWFHHNRPTNPNYWRYSVPYLDKFHIFSEMPVLGYFGYLFFGIGCWLLWIAVGYIFEFDSNIDLPVQKTNQ